jgi:predicted ATPase/predicted negative regulator of RcsB-dependent stress response
MNKSLAGDSSSTAQLDKQLSDQVMLLVLDTFEHLLALDGDAITALIDHILQHLPSVSLLITSRERLRLGGESIFELSGLGVPTAEVNGDVATHDVAASDAVILFLQRARQVSPSFALTPANRTAIVRLCNLLRGMPLGIELAAAWMRTLTPDEIATEIGRSLDFLTLADRGVPPRHRSLRAAFEHSWKLLSPEEQKSAARLSIFRGGFRRAGAQAVANASLTSLAALIDKSLVQVVAETAEQEGGLRYEIHELLRQYLRDKLIEMADEEAVARRHIDYFTAMAEEMEPHHHSPVSLNWIKKLRGEQGNLRAALEWSVTGHHAPELGLRLAGALGRFWYMCDAWAEGREWLRSALAAANSSTPPYYLAKALTQMGEMEKSMADYAATQRNYEEALVLWRELHEERHTAWTLFHLGTLASTLGDYAKAEMLLDESLAIYRRLNETRLVALVLIHLAGMVMQNGDYARCRELLDEAVPIFRTQERTNIMGVALNFQGWAQIHLGDQQSAIENFKEAFSIGQSHANQQMMGWSLRNLGMAHLTLHHLDEAEQNLRSCLRIYQQITFKSGMIVAFEILAAVAAEQEEMEEAVRWLAVAEKLRQEIGLPRTVSEEELYYKRARHLTTDALSQTVWNAAWAGGDMLSLDEALALATTGASSIPNR